MSSIEDALASEDARHGRATSRRQSGLRNLHLRIDRAAERRMIEHRNVKLLCGMDGRVARSRDGQDVWLAVTSLSSTSGARAILDSSTASKLSS